VFRCRRERRQFPGGSGTVASLASLGVRGGGQLEHQLGLALLDRTGYRVRLTEAGASFHRRVRVLLRDAAELRSHAEQLAMGEEAELRVVLGDLCPLQPVLGRLSQFFAAHPRTRLNLLFESVTGPWERLVEGEADVFVHRLPQVDVRMEWVALGRVAMVPVVAPGFLPFPPGGAITPRQLRGFTQCVIRDSARRPAAEGHFLVEGAPQCSVPDHLTKKELVLRGMAWGHLPRFMIDEDLREGRLLSIAGRHFPGVVEELVAARRSDAPHGPVANALWDFLQREGALLGREMGTVPRAKAQRKDTAH